MPNVSTRLMIAPFAALAFIASASTCSAQALSADEVRREAIGRTIFHSGSRFQSSRYVLQRGGRYTVQWRTLRHRSHAGGSGQRSGRYIIRSDGDVCLQNSDGPGYDVCYEVIRGEQGLEFSGR